MMTATVSRVSSDPVADVKRLMADQQAKEVASCEALALRKYEGASVSAAEIKSAIEGAGWTPDQFAARVEWLSERHKRSVVAAQLEARRESLSEVEQQRANEVAEHARRMSELDSDCEYAREDVFDSETARRLLF